MKIALLGYGKMGKTIEKIAIERGHEIVLRSTRNIQEQDLGKANVAIDFSVPTAAFENITACFKTKVPVISGTTGWLEDYGKAVDMCKQMGGSFLYASNFSIGVNLFFELNRNLAKLIAPFKDYEVDIEEIHHTQKLDAPSGTAISLAEQIIENTPKKGWRLDTAGEDEIPITAKRIEEVPGIHIIAYRSPIDTIEIKHTAHSRQGFALGAVIAAEWIKDKTGIFTMKDVLSIG